MKNINFFLAYAESRPFFRPFTNIRLRAEKNKLYDLFMRALLIAYSLFVLFFDIVLFLNQILARPSPLDAPDFGIAITILARACQWMFIALFAILPVFRLRPIAKLDGILPRLPPLAAITLSPLFLFLERAPPNLAYNSLSVGLGLMAGAMAVVSLTFLGRSFSIMPEARRLVTDGPYRWVRHPIYLYEVVIIFAMFLQYRSWPAAALFILIFGVQMCRAVYEEKVLAATFPNFKDYCQKTNFLVPGHPLHFLPFLIKERAVLRRLAIVMVCGLALLAASMLVSKYI